MNSFSILVLILYVDIFEEYIKENNSLNEEDFHIIWKTFQTFLVAQLPIVKSKFKATEWKAFVKEEAKKEKLQIKWRS